MSNKNTPSPTQSGILVTAAKRKNGEILPLPEGMNSMIQQRVIDGLLNRNWAHNVNDVLIISPTGFEACGLTFTPKALPENNEPPVSKQQRVIDALSRQSGATLEELQEMTGWQKHTVRGAISHALKTRLGLNVISDKQNGQRRYRIEA